MFAVEAANSVIASFLRVGCVQDDNCKINRNKLLAGEEFPVILCSGRDELGWVVGVRLQASVGVGGDFSQENPLIGA